MMVLWKMCYSSLHMTVVLLLVLASEVTCNRVDTAERYLVTCQIDFESRGVQSHQQRAAAPIPVIKL